MRVKFLECRFEKCTFINLKFQSTQFQKCNLEGARFSFPEVVRLLDSLNIKID